MSNQFKQLILIALVVALYLLVALPLPYLLVDHYSAVAAGDTAHSAVDIHVWLEWAAGSSLSGGKLVVALSQPFVGPVTVPSPRMASISFIAPIWSRGPPTC